jgi:hypothetical protein
MDLKISKDPMALDGSRSRKLAIHLSYRRVIHVSTEYASLLPSSQIDVDSPFRLIYPLTKTTIRWNRSSHGQWKKLWDSARSNFIL